MVDPQQRKDDAIVAEVLSMMRSMMNDFNGHTQTLLCVKADVEESNRKLAAILTAFPEGGLVQHRLDHERMMAADKSARNLREGVTRNIISGGAWATILIVAYALWDYLKAHLK